MNVQADTFHVFYAFSSKMKHKTHKNDKLVLSKIKNLGLMAQACFFPLFPFENQCYEIALHLCMAINYEIFNLI